MAFYLLCGILAIIFSVIALMKIKHDRTKWKGKGFAIAGLIIGIIEIAWFLAIMIIAMYIF